MIREQLIDRGISDKEVLRAMREVPRQEFVPQDLAEAAYADSALPIEHGQTISQPYIVAFMTEEAGVRPGHRVLEIGTGSGYGAAVLAEIASEVYTVEVIGELARSAEERLRRLGYANVRVKHGDGRLGWPEHAPYDAVLVTAAAGEVPQPLLDQLKTGGKLIIPLGSDWQTLVLFEKRPRGIVRRERLPVRFVPLTGDAGERRGL